MTLVKNIALYLPQYHSIPENDKAWGEGFTEWTNVKPAKPLYENHYQPHVPHDDIGYYSLETPEIMVKQAKMAKEHGIDGFCYYYYWFDGKTLLEKPLINMLNTPEVDIPFCLMWANHNWTKTWDAGNKEVIIEQTYKEETFSQFIDDLIKYFNDPRYIRIDNKPVLIIYQADLLPNPKKAVEVWRKQAKEKYNLDLYLILCQQNSRVSPNKFGYDAAMEGAPNFVAGSTLVPDENRPKLFEDDTKITMYDYKKNIFQYIFRKEKKYKLFKTTYASFDNTARRGKNGSWMFHGATPELFKKFLAEITYYTDKRFENPEEKLLFINAWNEWAEGAHLEPDEKYGYTYLNICKEIKNANISELEKIKFNSKEKKQMKLALSGMQIQIYKLFGIIPFLKCIQNQDKKKFYILSKILIFKIKKKKNITSYSLFGLIPLVTVKNKGV